MTKKLMLWLGISVACFTAFVLSAGAAEKETVSLSNVGGQIEAILELPQMPTEEIVALQLSFQIEAGQGNIRKEDISFAFDAGLPEEALQQCRYQEETGVLTIYISGNQDLYPKGDSGGNPKISLGRVIVNSDGNASVKVVKNSFKTVNRAHGMYEGEVNTGDGGQTINNDTMDRVADNNLSPEDMENVSSASSGEQKQDKEGDSGSSSENMFLVGGKKENKAGIVGSAKKIMEAAWSGDTEGYRPVSDKKEDSQTSLLPEDSLWKEGARLWKEKTGSVDMDVWTKIFFGLFAVSASVASALGIGLTVRALGKRKKRRRRRTYARRNGRPPTQMRNVSHKRPKQSAQRALPKSQAERIPLKREEIKRYAKTTGKGKKQPVRRTQGNASYREQPVWKDNKKTYVRKRRKIS